MSSLNIEGAGREREKGDPATRLIVPSSYWTRGATFNQLCCDTHNAQCLRGKERAPVLDFTCQVAAAVEGGKRGERERNVKTAVAAADVAQTIIPHTPAIRADFKSLNRRGDSRLPLLPIVPLKLLNMDGARERKKKGLNLFQKPQ